MIDPVNPRRRQLLLGLMTLPLTGLAAAALATPSATEGPFYPSATMRLDDIDNDLVKIADAVEQAGGEIVRLTGRVLDRAARPMAGARVEIWQCDVYGRYLHRGDSRGAARDPAFQGFGQDIAAADGRYAFRTIKPVPYAGRTPHIHVKVWLGQHERLTTQFYLPDHPQNDRDWLYRRIPGERRDLVTMNFQQTQLEPEASLDLVI